MTDLIEVNGLFYRCSTRIGQCGAKQEWKGFKKLYFPLFLMGACGEDDAVISWNGEREILVAPKKMDYKWFKLLAMKLEKNPMFDWDWDSFSRNILEPNRDHLREVLNLTEEKLERFLSDGFVFINSFEKDWKDEAEDEEELKDLMENGGKYPNFRNFLEFDEVAY